MDEQPPVEPTPVQRPPWLQDIYDQFGGDSSYVLTDDDLAMLSQWALMQQFQSGMGQMDLANRNLDYQNRTLDLNEEQLAQQYQEFEFMRDQYFPWYTGDYFDFMQQQAANEMSMSNNQLAMSNNAVKTSEHEIDRSLNYALAAKENATAAGYGADAARFQYLVQTGQTTDPNAQNRSGLSPMGAKAYGY